jgi:hypothetical protein
MSIATPRALSLLLALPVAAALLGCEGKSDDDLIPWAPGDNDGDGFTGVEGDCDDDNPAIYPEAEELCDGIDNNCDDIVDEDAVDAPTWYIDFDLDGYGGPGPYDVVSCEQPAGYVADGSDCDDTDDTISPDAAEICDGIDNDCNGETDEDAEADDATWYLDADSDGWGNEEYVLVQCDQPDGYVIQAGDCDDLLVEVNPEAEEICDELDNNCNDEVDEDVVQTFFRDVDGDGYGVEDDTEVVEGCEAPEGYTTNSEVFDCDDANADTFPEAPELCDGQDNDCDDSANDSGVVSWVDDDGAWTDLSSTLAAGTVSTPVSMTLDEDGALYFCDGTFYVNLEVDGAAVEITSLNGAGTTVLSGSNTGTVIEAHSGADLTLSGVQIQDGGGYQGGGLSLSYAVADISNAVITDNAATDDGGGIYISVSNVSLDNVVIQDNLADNDGGGIYVYGSSVVDLDGVNLSDNEAGADGGGVYAYGLAELSFSETVIAANTAGESGGGLGLGYSTTATMSLCTLSDNEADEGGGGAYLFGYSQLTTSTSTLEYNEADEYGGAIYLLDATAVIASSNLRDNSALGGGGVYIDGDESSLELSKAYVVDNLPEAVLTANGESFDYSDTTTTTCDVDGCL